MAENYIVINGKKAELTPEQLKALGLEREIESPFERAKINKRYFFINGAGEIKETIDAYMNADRSHLNVANYCTDREMIEQQAYREILNRLLWRYSMEHKGNEIDWSNVNHYCISYSFENKRWCVHSSLLYKYVGAPCFYSEEIAKSAIKEIVEPFMAEHPDFEF